MEKYRAKSKKKRSAFWIGYWIAAVLCVLAVAFTLGWMWGQLEDYEKATPQYKLNEYFVKLSSGDYEPLKAGSGFTPDENSTWDDYFALLKTKFTGDVSAYKYRKTMAEDSNENHTLFSVYAGDEKIGEVYLIPNTDTPMGFSVQVPMVYVDGYTITAPPHVTVFMNGKPLSPESGIQAEPLPIFSSLNDISLAPVEMTYTTPSTLKEPVFTAETATGGACTLAVDEEKRHIDVSEEIPAEVLQQYEEILQTAATTWSDFTTKDTSLTALQKYVYSDTDLAKKAREFQGFWYLDHEKREFADIKMGDFEVLADNCFVGQIDFTVNITFKGKVQTFYPSYKMAFLNINGAWLLAGMEMADAMTPQQ